MSKRILLIGEPMALFVADEVGDLESIQKFTRTVAGAEVNVAIGLTRLGHTVSYLSRVGDDTLGKYIINFLEKENIDTQYIEFDETHRTGIQLKNKVSKGDAYAPYFRKHSAATQLNRSILDTLDMTQFDWIHITGIPLALSASLRDAVYTLIDRAHHYKIPISFDPNIRQDLWTNEHEMKAIINDVASKSTVFLPGLSEAQLLSGMATPDIIADTYIGEGCQSIVIKCGPDGAYYADAETQGMCPGFTVDTIVDTVGAGDGFAAGCIATLLDGSTLEEASRNANAVGAIQVMHWSDNEGLPTKAELQNFIQKNS